MKGWRRALAGSGVAALAALAYYFGTSGTDATDTDTADTVPLDPGYAARDAEVIETGYDGRERYRLKAAVIRQQTESGVIDLEQLPADRDGYGEPVAQCRVASADPPPNWYRPSYRIRPIRAWHNLRAVAVSFDSAS